VIRGRFVFQVDGDDGPREFVAAGSEWWLFTHLRRIAREGKQLAWFESYGAPLVPRSLAALNCYLRVNAIRFFKSRRWDQERELLGGPEWRRFCRMLDLHFLHRFGAKQDLGTAV